MSQHQPSPSKTTLPPQLAAVNLHAAGIDIGAEAHFVAVPPSDDPQPVRSFGASTADLDTLPTGCRRVASLPWPSNRPASIDPPLSSWRRGASLLVDPQQVQKIKAPQKRCA